jgi:hypothetical protein
MGQRIMEPAPPRDTMDYLKNLGPVKYIVKPDFLI